MDKERLKFISYDGKYPNLCNGNLIMELDNKKIKFPEDCLSSGGSVWFSKEGDENVVEGNWTIYDFPKDFPEELKKYATQLINKNIEKGCCGGCI